MITEKEVSSSLEAFGRVQDAMGSVIVGHRATVRAVLVGLLCRGNVLLEGVPGLGKKLLVRALGSTLGLQF